MSPSSSTAGATEVVMPALSDGMEEGVPLRWLKADGTPVADGEAIAQIETDKATMELEAEGCGVLLHRLEEGCVVRRIVAELGVDLAIVQGSGRGGRIVRRGVEKAAAAQAAPSSPRGAGRWANLRAPPR
jgi:pyruvate/2-oxoglutarate dehydrogenase complex dihydrolipoamide acyltransferase (E2) component